MLRTFRLYSKTKSGNGKTYVGISNNHLNPVYVITWPLFMSKKPVYPVVLY